MTTDQLPALVGSPAAVAWAAAVRAQLLDAIDRQPAPDTYDAERLLRLYRVLRDRRNAGWWIDRRGHTVRALLRELDRSTSLA